MTDVRRIGEDEAPAVAALWDRMGRELPGGEAMLPAELRRIEFMLRACAWHDRAFCLVAWRDGEPVGFVNGTIEVSELLPGRTGDIETCYVVPEARRLGVGTALAEAALRWLGDRDADPVRLETWLDADEAIAFWATLGFERETVCLARYAEDAGAVSGPRAAGSRPGPAPG